MRSTDEQLNIIMQRADEVREKRSGRKQVIGFAVAAVACFAMIIIVSAFLPRVTDATTDNSAQHYGSLILAAPYMGYVVIGVLAFALGICVTLLCHSWRAMNRKIREEKGTTVV
ncbi:MAG: hypothetical protein J6Y20_08045 [Lachnospiraceae bacterium]|nr:hypothetical protein [Lachnospiraceae bacterium]